MLGAEARPACKTRARNCVSVSAAPPGIPVEGLLTDSDTPEGTLVIRF